VRSSEEGGEEESSDGLHVGRIDRWYLPVKRIYGNRLSTQAVAGLRFDHSRGSLATSKKIRVCGMRIAVLTKFGVAFRSRVRGRGLRIITAAGCRPSAEPLLLSESADSTKFVVALRARVRGVFADLAARRSWLRYAGARSNRSWFELAFVTWCHVGCQALSADTSSGTVKYGLVVQVCQSSRGPTSCPA
jgi:hypothetical protein